MPGCPENCSFGVKCCEFGLQPIRPLRPAGTALGSIPGKGGGGPRRSGGPRRGPVGTGAAGSTSAGRAWLRALDGPEGQRRPPGETLPHSRAGRHGRCRQAPRNCRKRRRCQHDLPQGRSAPWAGRKGGMQPIGASRRNAWPMGSGSVPPAGCVPLHVVTGPTRATVAAAAMAVRRRWGQGRAEGSRRPQGPLYGGALGRAVVSSPRRALRRRQRRRRRRRAGSSPLGARRGVGRGPLRAGPEPCSRPS